ncbi:MAG TPA: flagellar protein FlaG [Bacilli bacterium]
MSNIPIGGSNFQPVSDTTYVIEGAAAIKPSPAVSIPVKRYQPPVPVVRVRNTGELKLAQPQGEDVPITNAQLVKAIERAIKVVEGATTSLEFRIHKETHQIMVKVLNKETGEVIREIPPEKNFDFLAKLWQMAGILVDKRG